MTGSLWMVKQGDWQLAVIFYILATIGFSGGNIFYDSLLPSIASKEKIDYASSLGYALGYIGGGVLFLINVLMYLNPDIFGFRDPSGPPSPETGRSPRPRRARGKGSRRVRRDAVAAGRGSPRRGRTAGR